MGGRCPRAIYRAPANVFVASFLGTPSINRIEADVRAGKLEAKGFSLHTPPGVDWPARVVIGVRPEHVRISTGEKIAGASTFEAKVVHNEPLGAETYVYLDAAGTRIAARRPGWGVHALHDAVFCAVDPDHCLFFDAETGEPLEGAARDPLRRHAVREVDGWIEVSPYPVD